MIILQCMVQKNIKSTRKLLEVCFYKTAVVHFLLTHDVVSRCNFCNSCVQPLHDDKLDLKFKYCVSYRTHSFCFEWICVHLHLATGWMVWRLNLGGGKMSILALGPIQPPVQWVLGIFPRGKVPGAWNRLSTSIQCNG
jgi:hypothetical protein